MAAKKNKSDTMAVEQDVQVTNALAVADDMTETAIVAPTALPGLSRGPRPHTYGEKHAASTHKLKEDEVIIPMLKIVQESSKIWKERDQATCTFKLGDIYNSVTNEVYDGTVGVLLVPIRCDACIIERKMPPDGSFIAKLPLDDKRVQVAFKDNGRDGWKKLVGKGVDGNKVQFNYTDEVYCALISREDGVSALSVALVPFAATNVFPRKKWWTAMAEVPEGTQTPRYAFRTVLKTEFRASKTAAGVDSYMFKAEAYGGNWDYCRLGEDGGIEEATLDRCAGFEQLVSSGALGKADYSDADDSEAAQEKAAF